MSYEKAREKAPTRQLRPKKPRKPLEFSLALNTMLDALLVAARAEDVGVYLGPPSTTGGRKIKFYLGDEVVEDYVSPTDDPEELGAFIADQVFGAQVAKQVLRAVQATASQEAPGAAESTTPRSQVRKLRPEAPEGS